MILLRQNVLSAWDMLLNEEKVNKLDKSSSIEKQKPVNALNIMMHIVIQI